MDDRKTAVYLRVSSKRQDTRSQEPDLKRWCEAHGVDWPGSVYRDTFTGKTMDRPGFARLMADVRDGKVGRVVVWRLDRLGRTAGGVISLFDELARHKVTLVSLKEGFDASTPGGKLFANMLASFAAYETEVRAERTLAGQAAARAAGKVWGGGVKGRRTKASPEKRAAILKLAREGVSKAVIARTVSLSRPTVYSVLEEADSL